MADKKQSTKADQSNIVDVKREYYVPEYGVTVEATSSEEAVKVAKDSVKQEPKA